MAIDLTITIPELLKFSDRYLKYSTLYYLKSYGVFTLADWQTIRNSPYHGINFLKDSLAEKIDSAARFYLRHHRQFKKRILTTELDLYRGRSR